MRWKILIIAMFALISLCSANTIIVPLLQTSEVRTCGSDTISYTMNCPAGVWTQRRWYFCKGGTKYDIIPYGNGCSYLPYPIATYGDNLTTWTVTLCTWGGCVQGITRPPSCMGDSCIIDLVMVAHDYRGVGYPDLPESAFNCSDFNVPNSVIEKGLATFDFYGSCSPPTLTILNSTTLSDRYHFEFAVVNPSLAGWNCTMTLSGHGIMSSQTFTTSPATTDFMFSTFPNQTVSANIACTYRNGVATWTSFADQSWLMNNMTVTINSPSNGDQFTMGSDPVTVLYSIDGAFLSYNVTFQIDGNNVANDIVSGESVQSFLFNKTLGNRTITIIASNASFNNSDSVNISINPVVVTGGSGGSGNNGENPPPTTNTTSPPPSIFGPGVTPLPPITITTDQYVIIISPGGYNVSMAKLENFEDNLYVKNMGTSSVNIQFSTLSKYMAFVGVSPTSLVISPGSNVSFRVKAGGFTDEGYFEVPIAVLVNGEDKATAHIDATIKGEGSLLSLLFGGATSSLLGLFSAKITIPFIEFSITPIFLILVALAYYTGTTARIDGKWNKFYIVVVAAVLIVIFDMKLIFP